MPRTNGRIADYVVIPWLTELAAQCTHLSLSNGDPYSVGDPRTLEPSGGVYSRASVLWARSGRIIRNTNSLVWTGLLQNTVLSHVSGWDAAFNGNLLFATPISPQTYDDQVSGGLIIAANQLSVGMDF